MREEVNGWGAGTETLNEGTRPGRTEKPAGGAAGLTTTRRWTRCRPVT